MKKLGVSRHRQRSRGQAQFSRLLKRVGCGTGGRHRESRSACRAPCPLPATGDAGTRHGCRSRRDCRRFRRPAARRRPHRFRAMRVLVDTQCWLWMTSAPERFSAAARAIVESREHELYLSAASAWEIAIKQALGKLGFPNHQRRTVPGTAWMRPGFTRCPSIIRTLSGVSTLPHHHRDPFDRLLIAQAQIRSSPS